MKVNVLGTDYAVKVDSDYLKENNLDGICKPYDKEIVIREDADFLCSDDKAETKELRKKEVIRHELIHAFFDESGLDDYSNNEQLVSWLASQFPKLLQAFKDVNAI